MKYIVIKLVKQLNNIAQEVGKKKKEQKWSRTNVFRYSNCKKKNSDSVVSRENQISKFRD